MTVATGSESDMIHPCPPAIGGIPAVPAEARQINFDPGMRSIRHDMRMSALPCKDISCAIKSGQMQESQKMNHQIGKVLAHTLLFFKDFKDAGADDGAAGLIGKIAKNGLIHSVDRGNQSQLLLLQKALGI